MEIFSGRELGWILIGIAVALFFILSFMVNNILQLQTLLATATGCTLPDSVCPYKNNIPIPAVLGYIVDVSIAGLGVFLLFNRKQTERMTMESREKWRKLEKGLGGEEKKVYGLIGESGGFIFQNELVEKSGMNKVKVTRVLDKLETRGLVERKRRGMANVVVLKYS
jgi:hypothetical protein